MKYRLLGNLPISNLLFGKLESLPQTLPPQMNSWLAKVAIFIVWNKLPLETGKTHYQNIEIPDLRYAMSGMMFWGAFIHPRLLYPLFVNLTGKKKLIRNNY